MQLNRAAFDRNCAAFDRNTQAFERVMAALDRHEQMAEEQKIFIRDMNRRNELVVQQIVRDHEQFMARLTTRLTARDERADRKTDQILARLDDAHEESKAHRKALLAMIDRLPPAQAA
jgi:DNA-binding ferritin-like protein